MTGVLSHAPVNVTAGHGVDRKVPPAPVWVEIFHHRMGPHDLNLGGVWQHLLDDEVRVRLAEKAVLLVQINAARIQTTLEFSTTERSMLFDLIARRWRF